MFPQISIELRMHLSGQTLITIFKMTLPHVVYQYLIQAVNVFLDFSLHGQLIYDQRCHDLSEGRLASILLDII